MKPTKIFIITIILAATLLSMGCKVQETKQDLKVGAILPLSSWGAYYGEPMVKGMTAALQELQKEEKTNIDLYIEDSKSDTKEAVSAAQKLITVNQVDVLQVEFSGPANAISPIALSSKKLMIYDSFSTTPIKENPSTLKLFYDPYTECEKLAKAAIEKGAKKITGFMPLLDLSQDCKQAIAQVTTNNNIEVNFIEFDAFTTDDFRTQLTQMNAEETDAVIMLGYENNFLDFTKQREELRLTNIKYLCGPQSDCLNEKIISEVSQESLSGSITFEAQIAQEFKDKYQERLDLEETELFAAAVGYDMIMMLSDAHNQCTPSSPDCLKQALIQSKYETALITLEGFNDQRKFSLASQLKEFKDGELVVR